VSVICPPLTPGNWATDRNCSAVTVLSAVVISGDTSGADTHCYLLSRFPPMSSAASTATDC